MATVHKVKVKVKKALKVAGISYQEIATRAGCSWWMVWAVLNGHRTSQRIITVAEALLAERRRAA